MQPGRIILVAASLSLLSCTSRAQSPGNRTDILFYQLNTSDGLSDNYIWDMCTDKGGNLWIATGEGLNMFNGKTVIRFFTRDYPQLREDFTRQVVCDKNNRIWILLNNGHIAVIDEQRRFHKVGLYTKDRHIATRRLLNTADNGIVVFARDNHYTIKPGTNLADIDTLSLANFSTVSIKGFDTLHKKGFSQVEPFDEQSYLFVVADSFFKVNYATGQVEKKFELPDITVLTKWGRDQLLLFDHKAQQLQVFNLSTEEKSSPFDTLTDQYGKPLAAVITNAKWINKQQLILTTRKQGIYIYNAGTKQLVNHRHNAADPASIINNSPFVITTDSTGWVFIGATPNGISYFKSNAVIGERAVFQDGKGNNYDGFITGIATLDNDTYFIGTSDNLLQWKRSTNTTEFINYGLKESMLNKEEIYYIAFDNSKRLWVATGTKGIFILTPDKRTVRQLVNEPGKPRMLPNQTVRHMQMAPDGHMWISTNRGICRVNPANFEVDSFAAQPLAELKSMLCHRTWFDDADNVWIATSRGAWHYTISSKQLKKYTEKEGLPHHEVFCFNKDSHHNIYIGTPRGLHILFNNGGSKTIGVEDGLLNKRVEALLRDKNDRMWLGNDVGLACFNIKDTSLKVFDERYGLSIQGFRINSYHQNSDDELIWGTEKGLQYFYPDDLLRQKVSLPTTINRVETRDIVTDLTQNAVFNLSAADNYVTFYFSSIDYSKHLRTFYEYKLEGIDEKWIKVVDQDFVRYSSLPPGKYVFRVRASNDDKTWEEAGNNVIINIAKPLWRQTWFKLLGATLGLLLIWYVINFYRRKQKQQREVLETEVVVNYFASRINIHQQTEDILWDVARNCISKLQFEDCVIYLVDEKRNVLVQKAAWGPKMERDYTIFQPIEIPIGKGIVGTVAQTGRAELIANTELDPRYIPDDARRYSEIAVPLMIDNKVIGVIDSEHSRKNFFNQKHLNILSTIAVLCANQIQRSQAEEEKQKAKIEVLQNRQKVMESRLQSLRLQMNPHFLFNALNSIQQMILANEEMVATRYLSRFSKLLRTILIHSDKETVTLKEELEILNLYVELESVRFKDSFKYTIECDEDIDKDEVKVPTLLVQPFVENAIWHGLMHKEHGRRLKISFLEQDDHLQCVIEDNGIGREKAREVRMKTPNGKEHKSKGIEVSLERLRAMQGARGSRGTLSIVDLKDEKGKPAGTRVEINFPIQN